MDNSKTRQAAAVPPTITDRIAELDAHIKDLNRRHLRAVSSLYGLCRRMTAQRNLLEKIKAERAQMGN
jgi:hypothetical protein